MQACINWVSENVNKKVEVNLSTNNEWHKWRGRGIGSSDIASILGISPWKSAHQLWKERTGEVKAVDISNQYQVQRGIVNEPRARAMYELISGRSFPPQLCVHPEYDFMRVSLDGDDGESVLEIKCPGQKTIDEAKAGKVPDYYMCQVQYQMMCAQRQKGIFFCYHPEQEDYALVDIKPDLELQEKIKNAVIDFWGRVQNKVWEDETDFLELKDSDIKKMQTAPMNFCYCQSSETYKKLIKYCNQLQINFIPDEKKLTIIM